MIKRKFSLEINEQNSSANIKQYENKKRNTLLSETCKGVRKGGAVGVKPPRLELDILQNLYHLRNGN